jgi:hypothetical protein
MTKHEICVHIKDEEMLQKAKELLEKHGEVIDFDEFNSHCSFLSYDTSCKDWFTHDDKYGLTEITLDQLDGILKK